MKISHNKKISAASEDFPGFEDWLEENWGIGSDDMTDEDYDAAYAQWEAERDNRSEMSEFQKALMFPNYKAIRSATEPQYEVFMLMQEGKHTPMCVAKFFAKDEADAQRQFDMMALQYPHFMDGLFIQPFNEADDNFDPDDPLSPDSNVYSDLSIVFKKWEKNLADFNREFGLSDDLPFASTCDDENKDVIEASSFQSRLNQLVFTDGKDEFLDMQSEDELLQLLQELPVGTQIIRDDRYGFTGWKKLRDNVWQKVLAGLYAEGATPGEFNEQIDDDKLAWKIEKDMTKSNNYKIKSKDNVTGATMFGEEDEFFTKEELVEFGFDIEDTLNGKVGGLATFFLADEYIENNVVTIVMSDIDDNEYTATAKIDMRKILKPNDIYKYEESIVDQIWGQYQELNDVEAATAINASEDFDEYEDEIKEIDQEFTSENTSINATKLPAIFKMVTFEPGTINCDFGGGKFDNVADYLTQYDVVNLVYDPYNRSKEHNNEVIQLIKEAGGADTVTCSNVLNVIKEPEVRLNVLKNIQKLVKPSGKVYITVYEGTGKGDEGPTKSGYQLNKKTADYLEEIQQVFPDATRKGKLIVANPSGQPVTSATLTTGGDSLKQQITDKVIEVMMSSEFGFDHDDAVAYSTVEVREVGGATVVEIRAEVSYEGLIALCDACDPIVEQYDDDAYFEPVEPGIAEAWIGNAFVEAASEATNIDDLDPIYENDWAEVEDATDNVVINLKDVIVNVDEDSNMDFEDIESLGIDPDELFSENFPDIELDDVDGVADKTMMMLVGFIPAEAGAYSISGLVTLVYDIEGAEYGGDFDALDPELDLSTVGKVNSSNAEASWNFRQSTTDNIEVTKI